MTSIRLVCLLLMLLSATTSLADEPAEKPRPENAKHKHTNLLAKESSPYLLQHAHNPVNWHPWGEDAIQKAKRENKLIFLSIGYSACHWCHVMERESFEDDEIAKYLNDHFICIKVDREERPDIDQIYMTAVQIMSNGGGGWPLSAFLLPDTQPFWGGTYFPARTGDRGNSTGFLTIIQRLDQFWQTEQAGVTKQAGLVTKMIQDNQKPEQETERGPVTLAMVQRVAAALDKQFDPDFGGFGYSASDPNRPKFPEPANLIFLRDRMTRETVDADARAKAKAMLSKSLDGMISGAMLDHLGGGFHRYSVDRKWQIPHFEKMLYDNGQLASVYAQAAVDFDNDEYAHVARGICDFVIRELKASTGGFYSALDADSEGEEGKFYRWTEKEISGLKKDIPSFDNYASIYRLDQTPNFEEHYFALDPRRTMTAIASEQKKKLGVIYTELEPIRKKLFAIRDQRVRPGTDTKILTAWNGLMIAGLADAGRLLDEPAYISEAKSAADFLLREVVDSDGRLKRSYAGGKAHLNAYVDDYAFFASGLLALHRATGDAKWMAVAKKVMDKQIELFWDDSDSGFFFTSKDHASLIVRTKDPIDGAIPSGTSVSIENLRVLSQNYADAGYESRLIETLLSLVPMFDRAPAGVPRAAATLAAHLDEQTHSKSKP